MDVEGSLARIDRRALYYLAQFLREVSLNSAILLPSTLLGWRRTNKAALTAKTAERLSVSVTDRQPLWQVSITSNLTSLQSGRSQRPEGMLAQNTWNKGLASQSLLAKFHTRSTDLLMEQKALSAKSREHCWGEQSVRHAGVDMSCISSPFRKSLTLTIFLKNTSKVFRF